MKLVYEKITELSEEQFVELLEFLGKDSLLKALIKQASSFPKNSNYYLGPRTTGSFWSGFRKENIPFSRVKKFYIEEVLKNKTSLNTEFFKHILVAKIASLDNFDDDFIMSLNVNLSGALCLLYGVEFNDETKKYLNEINKIKKQNEVAIKSIIEEYEKK